MTFRYINNIRKKLRSRDGFTIVELLIVVVVIGILAAMTIATFRGVSQRANEASIISDLNGANKKLAIYKVINDSYPTSNDCTSVPNPAPPKICIKSSGNTVFSSYTADNSNPSNPHYNIVATNAGTSFYATDMQPITRLTTIAVTGGTVTTSGSDTIHTFTSTGTFIVSGGTLTNVSLLVVGGGGGGGVAGGSDLAGGGGGGRMLELSGQNVTGSVSVTIGNGGAVGVNGEISSFGINNAIGGGGGGPTNGIGKDGASGGGGGYPGKAAGIGVAGFSGGAGGSGGTCGGTPGGGGGAGGYGYGGSSCIGGQGGIGKLSTITGLNTYYAGGGSAEGIPQAGGGGSGSGAYPQTPAGTPNSGGGGGMSSPGGSGIIVIRYSNP